MKTKIKSLYGLLFFLLMACTSETKDSVKKAEAANEDRKEKADSTGIYEADAETSDFLVNAANWQMTEAGLGEMASQNGTHVKIKEVGDRTMKESATCYNEIKKLAAERNVTLPAAIGEQMQKHAEGLRAKKGAAFDKAFIGQLIKDHQEMVNLFEKAIEKANDPDVRTFASNTLPKLEEQLDSFRLVQKMIQ